MRLARARLARKRKEKGDMTNDLSPHQQKVLDFLHGHPKPLSAYEILDALHDKGFRAPPTVYRALEGLMKRGLIHKIQSLNAFVACSHEDEAGDHPTTFAICTSCGAVDEVECSPQELKTLEKKQSFLGRVDHEVLEISGVCRACCAKEEKPIQAHKKGK
jgi:Fur family zinc uptake transcriptional regulator